MAVSGAIWSIFSNHQTCNRDQMKYIFFSHVSKRSAWWRNMMFLHLVGEERKPYNEIASIFNKYFILLFRNIYKINIFLLFQQKIRMQEKKKSAKAAYFL